MDQPSATFYEPKLFVPPGRTRKESRFNFYCLQVGFCILLTWMVVANVILFLVFPSEEPTNQFHNTESRHGDDGETPVLFATVEGIVDKFLSAFESKSTASLLLIQPEILEQNPKTFKWEHFAKQPKRILTFILLDKTLPSCDTLDEVAKMVEGQIFCKNDGSHALVGTVALTFHLVSTRKLKSELYATTASLNDSSSWHNLWTIGLRDGNYFYFVNSVGVLPAYALEKPQSVTLDGISLLTPAKPDILIRELKMATFTMCNSTNGKLFYNNYPEMTTIAGSGEALEFRVKVRQILNQASHALNSLQIPFWLSSGTCLGWFRQCDVIPYSGDVDIGILIQDYQPGIVPALEEAGLQLKMVLGKKEDGLQLSFFAKDIKLDIYFFYLNEDNTLWNGATKPETGEKFRYTFPEFNLCWTEFLELEMRVPCPTLPYIVANYGSKWNEPVREWDWRRSPPNSKDNGHWTKQEMEQAVQVFHHVSSHNEDKEL